MDFLVARYISLDANNTPNSITTRVRGELEYDAAARPDSEALGYIRASGRQVWDCRRHWYRHRVRVALRACSVLWRVLYLRQLDFDDHWPTHILYRLSVVGFRPQDATHDVQHQVTIRHTLGNLGYGILHSHWNTLLAYRVPPLMVHVQPSLRNHRLRHMQLSQPQIFHLPTREPINLI